MRFNPGDEVVIVADPLNYGLPIDASAIVIKIDMNSLDCRNYLVRIPTKRQEFWLNETSIDLASEVNRLMAEEVLREQLIDMSLAKRNRELFDHTVNQKGISKP